MKASVVDGRVQCEFTRQLSLEGDSTFTDLRGSNTYYVIMSRSNGDLQADGKYVTQYSKRDILLLLRKLIEIFALSNGPVTH